MIIKQLQELVYHFRPEHETRPVLLLGAGASFKAGVPLAREMVNRIARFALAKESGLAGARDRNHGGRCPSVPGAAVVV